MVQVHYPELNDSKLIGMCIYNVALLSIPAVVVNLALNPGLDLQYAITSSLVLLGTTATQCIIFVPKVRSPSPGASSSCPRYVHRHPVHHLRAQGTCLWPRLPLCPGNVCAQSSICAQVTFVPKVTLVIIILCPCYVSAQSSICALNSTCPCRLRQNSTCPCYVCAQSSVCAHATFVPKVLFVPMLRLCPKFYLCPCYARAQSSICVHATLVPKVLFVPKLRLCPGTFLPEARLWPRCVCGKVCCALEVCLGREWGGVEGGLTQPVQN